MSPHATTRELILAAEAMATDYLARNPQPAAPDDTGERWLPLISLDMLLVCRDGVRWTITIYARVNDESVSIAQISNHVDNRLVEAHLVYSDLRYASSMPLATQELREALKPQSGAKAA